MNLAIIIGVSQYDNENSLEACDNDINIMKNILEKLNKFDDMCYISNSPKAYEAKQIITEFINKHKEQTIDELVFYFSGHGARFSDDFFYVFKDFIEAKKETTSLRNTELDGLIRNLSPKLTIKIVDACFSGTTYIKSNQDSIQPIFEKSAHQNKLNNLYFFVHQAQKRNL